MGEIPTPVPPTPIPPEEIAGKLREFVTDTNKEALAAALATLSDKEVSAIVEFGLRTPLMRPVCAVPAPAATGHTDYTTTPKNPLDPSLANRPTATSVGDPVYCTYTGQTGWWMCVDVALRQWIKLTVVAGP